MTSTPRPAAEEQKPGRAWDRLCAWCGQVYADPGATAPPPREADPRRTTHGICLDCVQEHFPESAPAFE